MKFKLLSGCLSIENILSYPNLFVVQCTFLFGFSGWLQLEFSGSGSVAYRRKFFYRLYIGLCFYSMLFVALGIGCGFTWNGILRSNPLHVEGSYSVVFGSCCDSMQFFDGFGFRVDFKSNFHVRVGVPVDGNYSVLFGSVLRFDGIFRHVRIVLRVIFKWNFHLRVEL